MATVTKVEFGKSSINPRGSGNDIDGGISSHGGGDDGGGGMLEKLERRVERLETDLTAARIDLTLIRERSENLATKSELAILTERSEHFATRADLEKMANSINSRITWSVMIPLAVAVLGFVIKSFVFK
ncbi:TPA: hypothetical protein NQE78_000400 [Klebsiella pneumoniae]|uniref:emp24/gp25L/p24 family protein n=1 Tax=Klebsiella pneumoniae complex TaxID=3390273 RepID=UPI0010A64765|nr:MULTISPECIES: emp24/gp25L/p24 family protein [Klebsiella]MCP6674488.1 emp24/gp25L/p24 family protein [Klebsiella pneumoniae]THG63267.1 emp24/gp25L/p24 family protein [Klebsiella variicola]HBV5383275.1 hypothetical protein [Klebsiella pneumoniae]HBY2509183.1 emp24/gp25L/p24 family protein [Klebsiella pneumoniae]HCA2702799.1 hypothetical protein [Klebsiella pneumoniae]